MDNVNLVFVLLMMLFVANKLFDKLKPFSISELDFGLTVSGIWIRGKQRTCDNDPSKMK